MSFQIMCTISGGILGSRQSILKSNGEPMLFNTREDARAMCKQLNARRMKCSHKAFVVEVENGQACDKQR
ncbi:MAG: hypothetical protein CMC15_14725 [Flavobacteriaceae bacterium]|nr:hypothetical protein [Flavobacteriaceae bacterium]